MFRLALAAVVLFTSFGVADAQPQRGVQRQRSATVNRVRPQGNPAFGVDRFTRPAQPGLPNTLPPRPRPNTTPNPVPTPTPTPTPNPNPRPPRPAPNVIIRLRSGVRYRIVIRNGVPVQVPYYSDGYVQESITQYSVPSRSSSRQYSSTSLIEQLQAENAALREENAYLKGQVQALQKGY